MVTKSETLRKIQTEHGLTGSFKDKPIAEWLAKHNPSELEYTRAVQNFTGILYNPKEKIRYNDYIFSFLCWLLCCNLHNGYLR